VSKKKSAKKTRAASATRRKATKSRSSSARRKRGGARRPRKIQLKPIKVLVDRALVDLRRLPPSDATDITIKHLESCSMALGDICDPMTPGGCGDTMEFPFPLALTTSRG
jgi:hypothetical protein